MKKVSYPSENANLQSCLSILFDVDEFEIQEDFLQISELVNTENHFMSRSTTETDLIDYLPWEEMRESEQLSHYEPLFTEYLGSLAFLSEKFFAFGRSISFIYHLMVFTVDNDMWGRHPYWTHPGKMDFWILGASYNYTHSIDAN